MEQGQSDIVVQAFSERYARAYKRVHDIEGGFVNDPKDRGGATKYGVSLRFLVHEGQIDIDGDGIADFDLDMDGDIDIDDIRALTPADARYLFHRCFWWPLKCDTWAAPIGEALFDQAVNGGLVAAAKMLQRSINSILVKRKGYNPIPDLLTVDGDLGDKTRSAFDSVLRLPGEGIASLIQSYRAVAADRYQAIVRRDPTQKRFLTGWLSRANNLGRL
ncbi:glycoside hydrolase family 108 protein [Sphingomonas paucimobilis]|uniref:Peptidoglycan domain protein n=1 Tax=Sphingomonas paucimobilis TaxID=13689 RepID=A0A7T3ABQ6_SPHPI|nr:glycosyl hydrolase 108 family protein [Sphingomonas paucimobilis]QPT08604.1 hypothetical protein I6G38_18105 [Sphingomonas paucimobilis]